jgi:hypothetical protein
LLGVAGRYAERELLTANPTFSSFPFVCSLEIKTTNDDRCMVGDHSNAWWAATPTFSSFSFVCPLEIKTRNDEIGLLRHPLAFPKPLYFIYFASL